MYYQNYEDYMRNMLGYSNPNNMEMPTYMMQDDYYQDGMNDMTDIENMYPDIYRKVYPMVCRACDTNTKPLTEDTIEEMVNSIVLNIEGNNEQVNVKMELKNGDVRNPNAKQELRETRQPSNNFLRDLIRILLIRELIRRRPNRPGMGPRPPFPGGPNRPPMGPGGRPPYLGAPNRPRGINNPYYY